MALEADESIEIDGTERTPPKDYVDWCGNLLRAVIRRADQDPRQAVIGVTVRYLARDFFGDALDGQDGTPIHPLVAVKNACDDLAGAGLLHGRVAKMTGRPNGAVDPTSDGRQAAADPTSLWLSICEQPIDGDHAHVMQAINQLSQVVIDDIPLITDVREAPILAELGWNPSESTMLRLIAISRDMDRIGFVRGKSDMNVLIARSTYKGVVWETRRAFTIEAREIAQMIAWGETTSTEIKRQVDTDTKDQKAEFVKDVLGLANTQANPPHVLLIGFDDKTGSYFGPPNAKLTQNHIEHLLSEYATPAPVVRYRVIPCPFGKVGRLDIERDPRAVPHRVRTSIGDHKRIEAGTIFVRHGSQTVRVDADEEAAFIAEAERVNARR